MDGILKADYGDKAQKAANEADRARAGARQAAVAGARQRVTSAVVPAMEKNKPYRPPFWQSKVYGEPYGDFNRQPKPQAVVRVNHGDKPAAGGVGGGGGGGGAGGGLNGKLRPTSARAPATGAASAAAAASRPKSAAASRNNQAAPSVYTDFTPPRLKPP